jgi:hypothetical protein
MPEEYDYRVINLKGNRPLLLRERDVLRKTEPAGRNGRRAGIPPLTR